MRETPQGADGQRRIVLPQPGPYFQRRAQRLRVLADKTPALADYLMFLAKLAEGQALAAGRLGEGEDIHAPISSFPSVWHRVLHELIGGLALDTAPLAAIRRHLRQASGKALDDWAAAVLVGEVQADALGLSLFIGAALQVVWTSRAAQQDTTTLMGADSGPGCPLCGSPPVASLLQTANGVAGLRYLHCGLCATEWLRPRILCMHCGDSAHIAYFGIEGGDDMVKAEACDHCRGYLKRIDRDKHPAADPCADDLATLGLDLLMDDQGYQRLGCNFFLMPGPERFDN